MFDDRVHLLVPHGSSPDLPGLVVHRCRKIDPEDVVPLGNGMRVTSVARTLFDVGGVIGHRRVVSALENALDRKQFNVIQAAGIIEQAVDRYPFKSGQREKLHLDLSQDFNFLGIESLCIYIMFNLLKNAYYSLQAAQKGELTIRLHRDGKEGVIRFRDSGLGIEPAVISRIFEGFFTTKQEGTGAGLAFCKRTIESFNGSIVCNSVPREFAEFIIRLPLFNEEVATT